MKSDQSASDERPCVSRLEELNETEKLDDNKVPDCMRVNSLWMEPGVALCLPKTPSQIANESGHD